MEDFLNGLVAIFPAPLRAPAQWVVARLLALWHTSTDFWGRIRSGWIQLRAMAWGRALAQIRHLYALAVTLRWIVTVYVPRTAGQLVSNLRVYVQQLWADAVNMARYELGQVRNWLVDRINDALTLLGQWAKWTLDRVSELRDAADRLNDRVFGVLGTPERLATWIVGAMVGALVDYAKRNAVRVGRSLVATRARIFLDSLSWIEDIVTRIF